jgi:hypothetical protein
MSLREGFPFLRLSSLQRAASTGEYLWGDPSWIPFWPTL